jgi:periplasmic divalent cation tolerance protein
LPGNAIFVVTQLPDRDSAQALARRLVEQRLAACVNIGTQVDSLYHWRGQIETAQEFPVLIKTTGARYAEVEAEIRANHPYELPEIVVVPIADGLPAYLSWIAAETALGASA